MRLVLNVLWLVLSGFWMALGYVLAGLVLLLPIVTIPFSLAAFRIAGFCLWPFGRTLVPHRGSGALAGSATSSGSSSPAGGWRSGTC